MGAEKSGKKVMVVIDESEYSYYALIWLLENLRESIDGSGNPLVIFMAQPFIKSINVFAASLGAARIYCPISATPEYVNSVQKLNMAVSLGILEKAKTICTSHGVNAETIAEIGDPKQAICDAIEKYNINLLVVGDHELGIITRFFVGSVSNYCVHNAKCPVLVVKKPKMICNGVQFSSTVDEKGL